MNDIEIQEQIDVGAAQRTAVARRLRRVLRGRAPANARHYIYVGLFPELFAEISAQVAAEAEAVPEAPEII